MGLTFSCIQEEGPKRRLYAKKFLRKSLHLRCKVIALWKLLKNLSKKQKKKWVFPKAGGIRRWRSLKKQKEPIHTSPYEICFEWLEIFHDLCLIPGLPNDVAMQCLARVPRAQHSLLRSVCKPWRWFVQSKEFIDQRKFLNSVEDWMYLHVGISPHLNERRDGRKVRWQLMGGYSHWHVLDIRDNRWYTLPPIPYEPAVTGGQVVLGASSAVLQGKLYVIGGAPFGKAAIRDVWVYDPRKNKWSSMSPMSTPRFASLVGVIQNKLYVVGGSGMCHLTGYSLPCLEVFDPCKNTWRYAASARGVVTTHPCNPLKHAAVIDNKFCVIGPHSITGRINSGVYDPETDAWMELWPGLRDGWGKPSTIMEGKLYSLDFGCYQEYLKEHDRWVQVKGQTEDRLLGWDPPLVSAMTGSRGKLYMVGTMGQALIAVAVPMEGGKVSQHVQWYTMKLPDGVDFLGDLGHCSCQVIGY